MRAVNIRVQSDGSGPEQMKASFLKNWKHYLQEALGLAIFMISACFFGAMLEAKNASLHLAIPNPLLRMMIMGILMGATAIFIFYSPLTSPSGSHINPAVTVTFLRLGKICPWDAFFYILFQFVGGTLAVYLMAMLLHESLISLPVHYAVTLPGRYGVWSAAGTEYIIACIMMVMVLFTSDNQYFKKYTRVISGCFVCLYVILAGPISGFGMNPARSFASALPAHEWNSFWIYMIIPFAGMLSAAELYLFLHHSNRSSSLNTHRLFR